MNIIEQILNSNLTQEQKEALLGQYANELMNNKEKRQELIEKNRKQAEIVRERNKAYEEKSHKEEEQKKREKELEEKLDFIVKEEEKKGKPIDREYLKELTGYEIEAIYNNITEGKEELVKKEQDKKEETIKKNIKVGPKLANNRIPYYDATKNSSKQQQESMHTTPTNSQNQPENDIKNMYPMTVEKLKEQGGLNPEPNKVVKMIKNVGEKAKNWFKNKKRKAEINSQYEEIKVAAEHESNINKNKLTKENIAENLRERFNQVYNEKMSEAEIIEDMPKTR